MWQILKISTIFVAGFWWLLLVHLRVFLFQSPSTASAMKPRTLSKCPFKLAKEFLGNPTALFANSLMIPNPEKIAQMTTCMSMMDLHQWRHQHFMSLGRSHADYFPAIHTNMFDSYCHSVVRPSSRLYAGNVMTATEVATAQPAPPVVLPSMNMDSWKSDSTEQMTKKRKAATDNLETVVIGLSHHNARVEVREKLAIPEREWNEASKRLCEYESIQEAAVLSTCNRFEIYLTGENSYDVIRDAIDFLLKQSNYQIDENNLRKDLFMLTGEDAVWHLMRVSAGLDSLIVGEGQILAQVKKAYEHGLEEKAPAGKVVSRLLNAAVTAGKRVRDKTEISKGAVSISSAAAEFSAMKLHEDCGIVTGLESANIAIIGAGKMAKLLLDHLETQGVKKIIMINRSMDRMKELQAEFPTIQFEMHLMDNMWEALQHVDIVYPSTASDTTIIDPIPLKQFMEKRKSQKSSPMQIVDISVPRNVHPECATVDNVKSYNVDDLKAVVERNTMKRKQEIQKVEVILREEMSKFRAWQQSLGAVPTINKLQQKFEKMRIEELSKAMKKLTNLGEKEREMVERVTKGIVAKILHGPMSHLRSHSVTEGGVMATKMAIQQVSQAFQLEP